MSDKKEPLRSEADQRAQDEAGGMTKDGRIMLTNDSGEVKRVTQEEWFNEISQAVLIAEGWRVIGDDKERLE